MAMLICEDWTEWAFLLTNGFVQIAVTIKSRPMKKILMVYVRHIKEYYATFTIDDCTKPYQRYDYWNGSDGWF